MTQMFSLLTIPSKLELSNIILGHIFLTNTRGRRGVRIQKPADLARAVKTHRQAQGLTQQDVADAVGITRQSLARIERGHGGVSFDTVLRIIETLGLNFETTSNDRRHIIVADPQPINDAIRHAGSAALAAARTIDTSAIAAAALAAARTVDTSALTAVGRPNMDTSAIAAAAAAAARTIDTSSVLSSWRAALDNLTSQVQQAAERTGFEPSAPEARKALLKSAIDAGDPDRNRTTHGGASARWEPSDGKADD